MDVESLGEQGFDEPAGLEQRGIIPRAEDTGLVLPPVLRTIRSRWRQKDASPP
jgi:hypothetical protein